jgi:hypothetical protein
VAAAVLRVARERAVAEAEFHQKRFEHAKSPPGIAPVSSVVESGFIVKCGANM